MGHNLPIQGAHIPLDRFAVQVLDQMRLVQPADLRYQMKFLPPGIAALIPRGHHASAFGMTDNDVRKSVEKP